MYFEGAKRSLDIVGFSSFFFSHRLGQPTNNTTHTGHPLIIKWVGALLGASNYGECFWMKPWPSWLL